MIVKLPLIQHLRKLDKLYNEALLGSDIDLLKYYSRLAVLELGGWVEECVDDIVFHYTLRCRNRLHKRDNINDLKDRVDKNYGFHYERNFRRVLKQTVGYVMVVRLSRQSPVENLFCQGLLVSNNVRPVLHHLFSKYTSSGTRFSSA